MKLNIFKKGLTIKKLKSYLELIQCFSEERNIPISKCYKIEDLSTEDMLYTYFCSYALFDIKIVNLLRTKNGLVGLSLYDIYNDRVFDVTDCEYKNIKRLCCDTFLLEKQNGATALSVKGKTLFDDLHFVELFNFYEYFFVLTVCDTTNKFHYICLSFVEEDFYILHSVVDFLCNLDKVVTEYRRLDYMGNISLADLDSFKEQVIGYMMIHGFCH